MACTPGGEARVLLPFPLQFSLLVFQLFSSYHLSFSLSTFFFSPSLPLSLLFFLFPVSFFFISPPGRERGRLREITRPPWAPAQPSRAQCSLLSQFANRAPDPRIVHLHFTIFRSEINTAPSAPHHGVLSSRGPRLSPATRTWSFLVSRRPASGPISAARPTDPENRRRPCEISRSMEIARSPIGRPIDRLIDRTRWRRSVIKKA